MLPKGAPESQNMIVLGYFYASKMGMYKYLQENWKKNSDAIIKQNLLKWRDEPATIRIERPSRLDRARALGYKPKQGIILVRQRVERGGRMREKIRKGRRTRHMRRVKILSMNYQTVAEQRAARQYTNCEVLNSYYVGQDGEHYWYEIILVERSEKTGYGRVFRGLTSSARKSRGLRKKGKGSEKNRPSRNMALERKIRSHI